VEETSKYLLHAINDTPTRWNSSYLAWTRLILIKEFILDLNATLELQSDADSKKDARRLKEIMLTKDEWKLIQDLLQVLGPIEEVTTFLGGSFYVTHSIMNRLIKQLMQKFTPDIEEPDTTNFDNYEDAFINHEEVSSQHNNIN